MSNISAVIENINDTLSGSALEGGVYAGKVLKGIAYPYPTIIAKDTLVKIVPAIYGEDGKGELVTFSNKVPVLVYHRILNQNLQYIQDKAVGDNYTQRQQYDAAALVCAWRPTVKMSADDLAEQLVNAIPNNVKLPMAAVKKVLILPAAVDLDFIRVFRQEFDKVDYFLKPEQIFFQIKYKVQIDVSVNCNL